MTVRWTWAAALFGMAACLIAREAAAERVLLLRPLSADATLDEAFNRLRAELELNEFEVVTVDEGSEGSSRSLAASAERARAFAAIAWVRHDQDRAPKSAAGEPGGPRAASEAAGLRAPVDAEVWIGARPPGQASERFVELGTSREAPNVLAVRVVDLLRASLRERPSVERAPPPVVGPEARPPPRVPAASEKRWQLRAEALQMGAWSSIGAAYGPSIGFSHRIADRWRVGVALAGPLLGASWSASQGSASIWQALGIAEVSFAMLRSGAFTLSAAGGAGLYHLHAQGEPDPPLVGQSDDVNSFLASVGLSAEFRFASGVALVVGGRALALTPRPIVAIDQEQTTLSMPLAVVSAGLAIDF